MALATLKQSIQEKPDATKDGAQLLDWTMLSDRGPLLPAYGTQQRAEALLNHYRADYNWAVKGAFAGICKLLASTPWEIKSDTESAEGFDVDYFQQLLRQADFGTGWSGFIQKVVLDWLRYDRGAFIELIYAGNPMRAPTGPVLGIAHLDSFRCMPTGDPLYPVLYVDRKNKLHRLHNTRVIQLLDSPDGDERIPGNGQCALSRAIAIATREMWQSRYVQASLDDQPPPGIVMASGITKQHRDAAFRAFRDDQSTDLPPEWGRQVWFFGADRDAGIGIEMLSFQQPPDKFDLETYTARVNIPALALAIGIDIQDLWQLTGGNIGSGAQSEVLHQKARGKTIGFLRTELERVLNDVLPEAMEFTFKYRDTQADQEQAAIAAAWVGAITAASAFLMDNEARELIAGVDDRFHDVMTDDDGVLVERDDADVKPAGQTDEITQDENEQTTERPTGSAGNAGDQPRSKGHMGRRQHAAAVGAKDFQATRLDFEADWADLIQSATSGDVARARFRLIARALLRRHGQQAYKDGLEIGGVVTDGLDDDDLEAFADWLAGREVYLSGLAERIYKDQTAVNPESSADMWANNSLTAAYYEGMASAAGNAMFEFAGEDGAESCATCKRLKGQRHRMKDWTRRLLRPGVDVDNFDCGGFHCNHVLVLTTERARGRF